MKKIHLDGATFSDLAGFYDEIQRKFCPDFDGFGRNLDALNDVLRGGFGVFELDEPVEVWWEHSQKSRADLSDIDPVSGFTTFEKLLDIFSIQKIQPDGTLHILLYLK